MDQTQHLNDETRKCGRGHVFGVFCFHGNHSSKWMKSFKEVTFGRKTNVHVPWKSLVGWKMWVVSPKIGGFYPTKSSILIRISIINPSILGYPYFWKHPCISYWNSPFLGDEFVSFQGRFWYHLDLPAGSQDASKLGTTRMTWNIFREIPGTPNSGTPFPILLPYHSHKNPLKYGNGKLIGRGSHYMGRNPLTFLGSGIPMNYKSVFLPLLLGEKIQSITSLQTTLKKNKGVEKAFVRENGWFIIFLQRPCVLSGYILVWEIFWICNWCDPRNRSRLRDFLAFGRLHGSSMKQMVV